MKKRGEQLSEKPFLGIVQISLCRESFARKWEHMEDFLRYCESIVKDIAEKVGSDSDRCLYRSSNTGDFCLVVRTGSVEEIYEIALYLNRFNDNSDDRDDNQIRFSTYTSVGIECITAKDGSYCTLSKRFVDSHSEVRFALRFSAGPSLAKEFNNLKQIKVNKEECTVNKGVFGRYDYLLHIGMKEFAEIYPLLCEKKLGKVEAGGVKGNSGGGTEGNCGQVLTDLQKILMQPSVRIINERILVDLSSISAGNRTEPDFARNIADVQQEINDKNQSLFREIKALKSYDHVFFEEHRAFLDLFRETKELYKAFSAIGVEEDAYMNWLIFYQDMKVLCSNLNKWIDTVEREIKDENENKEWRISILRSWRNNIQAINEYTRLVQNVNYQNYQSPSYEIQTQSDAEKLLVAYRELMEVYFESCYKLMKNEMKEKAEKKEQEGKKSISEENLEHMHPIIYPELSKSKVVVMASFLPMKENRGSERILVCTVPSFEYFGRLYDLLPWIMHESSHHIRILERGERNGFVLEYSMRTCFRNAIADILMGLSDDRLYEGVGTIEDLLVESMLDALKEFYPPNELKTYNFEELVRKLVELLKELFMTDRFTTLRERIIDKDSIQKTAATALLNEYRQRCMVGDKINSFEKLYQIPYDKHVLENLMEELLEIYWYELPEELKDEFWEKRIRIEDLQLLVQLAENKLTDLWITMKGNGYDYAVKNYIYSVRTLSRIYHTFRGFGKGKEFGKRKKFLETVYKYSVKNLQNFRSYDKDRILEDPTVNQAFRRMGLKNLDEREFVNQMEEKFSHIDGRMILAYHELGIRTYREANADLLMALSLNMTAFGYCRQVFQTISEAKLQSDYYDYGNINYERLRTIAAVLLWKEKSGNEKTSRGKKVSVWGKSIADEGKIYCCNILKYIREKMFRGQEAEGKEEDIKSLLGAVNDGIEEYLNCPDEDNYKRKLLLYGLIRQDKSVLDPQLLEIWEKYQKIVSICRKYRHLFWRLECFLVGLSYVLDGQMIVADGELYRYMKKICLREEERGAKGNGCSWEKDLPDYLADTKRSVGDYYNNPETVYTEKTEQKLDNTIDFIQNYYYHNRFRLWGKRYEESGDTLCGEPV